MTSLRKMAAGFAALSLLSLAACSDGGSASDSEFDLVNDGKLTYGVAATFPPFESLQNGELVGFDIDMIGYLADYHGLETEALDIDFDGLIPALTGSRIDVVNSAMYINEERAEQVDFIPYLTIGEAVLVPAGNPEGIVDIPEDLSGKTIAVTRGAIGETYMVEFNEELEEMGLEPMNILALPTNQDALLAVKSGRAHGFDTSTPGAAHTLTEDDFFEIAGVFSLGTEIGIAVRKGDEATKALIEEALQDFVNSGEYENLIAEYNLPEESILLEAE